MVKYWKDLARLPRGMWVLSATALVNRAGTMVMPFLTLYMTQSLGFSASRAGFVLFLYGIAAIPAGPLAGRLSDRIGPVAVMKASLFGTAAVFAVFSAVRSFEAVAAVAMTLGAINESFRPASMAVVSSLVAPRDRKSAFALYR